MAKKAQEIEVPAGNQEPFEPNVEGIKLQMKVLMERVHVVQEGLGNLAEGVNNLKQAYFSMDNKLDTIIARIGSIGTLTAQSAPKPAQITITEQPPQTITPMEYKPFKVVTAPARAVAPPPSGGMMTQPVQQAPVQGGAPGQQKQAADRLSLDGAGERGQCDGSKGWPYETLTINPIEFTDAAIKVTFPGSWNAERNKNEVWLAKKLISPESVIYRLQQPQTINVVNWWIRKNSVQQ